MARILLKKGKQKLFFEKVLSKSKIRLRVLAKECGVSERTIRGWRGEKYRANYNAVLKLSKKYNVPLGRYGVLSSYWYVEKAARLGGIRRNELHGLLGSIESRRLGGVVSQQRRRLNPKKYRTLGCIVRKVFNAPRRSEMFAELCGAILGDGAITDNQVRITLDKKVDRAYASHVQNLMERTFGEAPSWIERENVINLTLSGVALVETLEREGLKKGNKVLNQVGFPSWISEYDKYKIACVRGLFDTDGSIYLHRKKKKDYLGWCFTNNSRPLLNGVLKMMIDLGIACKRQKLNALYVYNLAGIREYMRFVGSNNPKHRNKVKKYLEGCTEW